MMTASAWPDYQRAATEVPRNSGHPPLTAWLAGLGLSRGKLALSVLRLPPQGRFFVGDPSVSSVPPASSVEELLVVLAQRNALIAALAARVAELESRLGKN